MNSLKAPWTDKQVEALNCRQKDIFLHPYTCGNCKENLIAGYDGWSCPSETCNYTQDWCHSIDAEYGPQIILDSMVDLDLWK